MITLSPTFAISPAELPSLASEYGEFLTLTDALRWARARSVIGGADMVWAVWEGRSMYVRALVLLGRVFEEKVK